MCKMIVLLNIIHNIIGQLLLLFYTPHHTTLNNHQKLTEQVHQPAEKRTFQSSLLKSFSTSSQKTLAPVDSARQWINSATATEATWELSACNSCHRLYINHNLLQCRLDDIQQTHNSVISSSFSYLLVKHVYDSLFLLFSKHSRLQLLSSNLSNSFF